MTRRFELAAVVLTLALAAPAFAQVRVRDHRKRKAPPAFRVDRFSPRSGPVGAEVTLYGEGFGRTTVVLFGGRRIRPTRMTSTRLTFRVPHRYGDAEIVVRSHSSREINAGTFHVESPPVLRRFAPTSGVAGTRVEIWGAAFELGDEVLMNGRSIRILEQAPQRLLVEIPDWGKSDYLTVRHRSGGQGRTRTRFRVTRPAPRLLGMQPRSGPPGALVRLRVEHYASGDRVYYGRLPLAVKGSGAGWIEVSVPERARRGASFRIRGPGGEGFSPAPFRLELPPVVTRFEPEAGRAGEHVEIYGRNFRAGDRVQIDGRRARVLQLRPRQITVEIPGGARTGALVVVRGGARVRTQRPFEIGFPPQLSSFEPRSGEPGREITLRGRYLAAAEVYYGDRQLSVLRRDGDHALVVRAPARAGDRRFRVRSRFGEDAAGAAFVIRRYPTFAAVSPRRGGPGTRIRIRGRDLERVDAVYLGEAQLSIVSRHPRFLEVEIGRGAASGRIAWSSYGRRKDTRWSFDVLTPPRLTGAPTTGYPGAEIVLDGEGFGRRPHVYLGKRPLAVTRSTPRKLWVRLPRHASGASWLWVEGEGGRVRSPSQLTILRPAKLRGFSPRAAVPGGRLTLRGRGFSPATRVTVDRSPATIVSRNQAGTEIVIEVPEVREGRHVVWVREGSRSDRARRPLFVRGYAALRGFSPARAKPGDTVLLRGSHLASARVTFGDRELPIARADRAGRRVWVTVPDGLHGSDWLYVDDSGHRSRSTRKLEIEKPSPPPVRVRDHRKRHRGRGHRRDHRRRGHRRGH